MGNSLFSKLSSVKAFEKSKYFAEGRYIVEFSKIKLISGHRGESFVIEAVVKGALGVPEGGPDVGDTCAQVWNVSGEKRELGLGTWKGFLEGIQGDEIDSYSDEQLEHLSNKILDGALEGKMVRLDVWTTTTKSGGDFTVHRWLGAPSEADLEEFGIK